MFTPKLFSISPTEKVIFSSGNLQYNLYGGAWRFASSQLECIGLANSSLLLIRRDGSYDIDAYFAPYGCSVRLVKNICIRDNCGEILI